MEDYILINKPLFWTSNDVVVKIRNTCGYKKLGHSGTLDPCATGLLILCANENTKLLNNLKDCNKQYHCIFQFNTKTNTGDQSGQIIQQTEPAELNISFIQKALMYFKQTKYWQKPHLFSAVKIHGKKAYEYARNNIDIEIKPKEVKLLNYKIINYDENKQSLELILDVSKGFYIRSFCQDLAQHLNKIAFVSKLHRTKCGDFDIANAYTIQQYIEKQKCNIQK